MKKRWWYGAAALALLAAAGCASAPQAPKLRLGLGKPDGYETYEKINPAGLYFELVSKPVVYAGSEAKLVFALRNSSGRSVEIREWLRNEPENIKIMIQPYLPGMKTPDPQGWIELIEPEKRPVIHYPLILMPENQVLVTKNLNFIAKLYVPPRSERRFFMRAESTLQSLKLASDVIVLHVLPNQVVRD